MNVDTRTNEYAQGLALGDSVRYHGPGYRADGIVVAVPDGRIRDGYGNTLVGIRRHGENTVLYVPDSYVRLRGGK